MSSSDAPVSSDPRPLDLRAGIAVTAVFGVVQLVAVIQPSGVPAAVTVLWSASMFVVGSAMFMVAFVLAAGRSRDEQVTMAGVIWLSGAAPVRTARAFRVLLGLQVVVAVAAASIRPFTALAFGILAPMYGLGTMALHAARKGDFAPIVVGERKSAPAPGSDHARASASDDSATGADERAPEASGSRVADADAPEPADRNEDPDDFDQLFRRRRRKRR